jgi:hypothetical protein
MVGVMFLGTEGYLIVRDYGSYDTFAGGEREEGRSVFVPGAPMMDLDQFRSRIAAARSRRQKSRGRSEQGPCAPRALGGIHALACLSDERLDSNLAGEPRPLPWGPSGVAPRIDERRSKSL